MHDWTADTRPLAACLKDWHGREGRSRDWAAAALGVGRPTYDGWCAGKSAGREAVEGPVRRAMMYADMVAGTNALPEGRHIG